MAPHPDTSAPSPVAIVTGAGSGIGRAICILLAHEGFRLALVGRTEANLDETIRKLGDAPPPCTKIVADIAQPDHAKHAIDETLKHFGRIDILINNAGAVELVPIEQTTPELLHRMFAVNFFGPAHMIARIWPTFAKQRSGCIINISSMSAVAPFPGLSAYAAAKSALESLTRSIHNEGRVAGIRAFAIAPGAVETAMLRSIASESDLSKDRTLVPDVVAKAVVDCVLAKCEQDIGRVIRIPSP